MASFCTIHSYRMIDNTIKYKWLIFSYNMRKIAESPRFFNQPHHARNAAKKFINTLNNCDFRKGIVR